MLQSDAQQFGTSESIAFRTTESVSYRLKIFQCLNFSCSRIKFSNQSLAFDCISVDNDPHFVVQVTGIKESVCFDVSGRPGQVMQLIHDNITGK